MMAVHRRMLPSSFVNPGIGRAFPVGPDAEQRPECIEGIEAAVKAERELIEVGLQVLRFAAPKVAADPVAALADHARAELMQDLEGRFVPAKAKLALELHGGHAGRHARNEIGGPKPDRQRRVRALHHGIDRQRSLLAACAAGQDAGSRRQPKRLTLGVAMRADETFGPLRALQVSRASGVILEKLLEVPEGLGERQVFPLEHVSMRGHLPHPALNETPFGVGDPPAIDHGDEFLNALVGEVIDPRIADDFDQRPEAVALCDRVSLAVADHGSALLAELVVGRDRRVVFADGQELILDLVEGGQPDTAHDVAFLEQAIVELIATVVGIPLKATNELAAVSQNIERLLSAGRKLGKVCCHVHLL